MRIRTIKPSFFASQSVVQLTPTQRLLWIALWCASDDHGRCQGHVRLIKAIADPLGDLRYGEIEADLAALAAAGKIQRYNAAGRAYIAINHWHIHQQINRPTASKWPPPPVPADNLPPGHPRWCSECHPETALTDDSVSPHGPLTKDSHQLREDSVSPHEQLTNGSGRGSGKGRGRARERDARKCAAHQNDPAPPNCGKCADARKAAESQPTPTPRADTCAEHGYRPSWKCPQCEQQAASPDRIRAILQRCAS